VTVHRWNDIPEQQVSPLVDRQFITGERLTVARFLLRRGSIVGRHSHESEQLSYIISGALKFVLDGQEVVVRGGEVIQIPPNLPHAAEALEDTHAIDMFSPIRQDWVDGSETYFRQE
jgi:quercetin dioxygenase-like cupin family protein